MEKLDNSQWLKRHIRIISFSILWEGSLVAVQIWLLHSPACHNLPAGSLIRCFGASCGANKDNDSPSHRARPRFIC